MKKKLGFPRFVGIKLILQKLGLYVFVRGIYQSVSHAAMKEKKANKKFYSQWVSPGDLCFDVGANVGQTVEALIALKAKVVAVEPNQHCVKVLRQRFKNTNNLSILPIGLGSKPSTGTLYCMGTASTASLRDDWPHPTNEEQKIEITTLDLLIQQYGRPKLLKIDVEGYESEVIKGLSESVPIIYFEVHKKELNEAISFLSHLNSISSLESLNLAKHDNTGWYFDDWTKYNQFLKRVVDLDFIAANIVVYSSPISLKGSAEK